MSNANLVAPSEILPWEEATLPEGTLIHGVMEPRLLRPLTLVASLAALLALMPLMGLWAVAPAFLFGRLLAYDATTYTLPDVYTLPLIAAGLAHALWLLEPARLIPAAAFCGVYLLSRNRPLPISLGGGDYKLLAALFLWQAPAAACFTLAVGCLVWLPFTLKNPKKPVPFGVPVIIGWLLLAWGLQYAKGLPIY